MDLILDMTDTDDMNCALLLANKLSTSWLKFIFGVAITKLCIYSQMCRSDHDSSKEQIDHP